MIPTQIQALIETAQTPDDLFRQLMPAIAQWLECDRCFLYLRDPQTRLGRVPFCWTRNAQIPTVYDADWKPEPPSLPDEDPMFAAALRTEASIFVEDVETANPEVLNAQFERENFGHRALIHAHLCQDHQLWGVLQPCIMQKSRFWDATEKDAIHELIPQLTPFAVQYVNSHCTDLG